MTYKVIDPKGIAYSDDNGRQVIAQGGTIPARLLENNCFTQAGIASLIKGGRLVDEEAGAMRSPQNKKAPEPQKKSESKKGARRK